MKRKFLTAFLLCALLLGTLSACGNGPDATTPVATTPSDTAPAETTPAATTPSNAAPAETTPAATTPSDTTPAETTPAASAPTGSLIVTGTFVPAEDAPLLDAEKLEIEASWLQATDCVLRWFDEDRIATRHFGVRYYGSAGDVIFLAVPQKKSVDSEAELSIYAFHEGTLFPYSSVSAPADVWVGLDAYDSRFAAEIEQREDLDDPGFYGGEHPSLGDSPYTRDQLLERGVRPHGSCSSADGYLGTYNGNSVYALSHVEARGSRKIMIGGLCFWWERFTAVVCNDTDVYPLDVAFEQGLLGYEDLRAVAYYWYGEECPEKPHALLPSVDDDFADDAVLLVMTREASLRFHTYTPEDFPELACVRVDSLSTAAEAITKAQLERAGIDLSNMEIDEWTTFDSPRIEEKYQRTVNNYCQILRLTLAEPGKENVIDAIALLREREDVKAADPDYVLHIEWD